MGLSKQQLDHLLAGRRQPTLRQALQIASYTGIEAGAWTRAPYRGSKG